MQNSQESICVGVFFNKAIGWRQAGFGETFMNTLFCSTSLEAACLICYANEFCIWPEHYSLPAHCVKSVRIRSFSDPYFPAFRLNTDQETSEYEHVSCSGNNLFKTFNTFNLLNVFSYRKKKLNQQHGFKSGWLLI